MSISVDETDGAPIKARSRLESRSTSEERSSKMYPPLKKKRGECFEEDELSRKQNNSVCWEAVQSVGVQMDTEDTNGSGSTATSPKNGVAPKLLVEVTEVSKGCYNKGVDDNNNNNHGNGVDETPNSRLLEEEKEQEDKSETNRGDAQNSPVYHKDIANLNQQYLQTYEIYARQQSLQQQQQQLLNLHQDQQQDQQPIDCTQEAQCLTTRTRPDEHRPDRYYGLEQQRLLHNPESVRDMENLQKQQIYGQETGLQNETQKLIEDENGCQGADQMTSVEECSDENLSEQRNSSRISELMAERAEQQQEYYILSPSQQQLYQQQQNYEQQGQLYQQGQELQAENQETRDQDQAYLQECNRKYNQEVMQLFHQQKLQQMGEQQSYRLTQPRENDGRNDISEPLEQSVVVNSDDALAQRHQLHRSQHYEQLVQQEDQQNLAGQYFSRALSSNSPVAENLVYLQQKNQLLCQLNQQQIQAANEREPSNIEVEQSFQELKPIDPNHFHPHYAVDSTSQQRTQQQLLQQFYLQQLGQQMNQQQQQQHLQTTSLLQHHQQQQQHYQIQLTNLDQHQQQQQYQQNSDHNSVSKSLQQKILLQQAVQEARQVVKQHDQSLLLNQYQNSAAGTTAVLPATITLPGSVLKKSGDVKSEDATAGKSNDEKVKRPMNAFMVWSRVERRRISQANPTMHNSDISKQLGGAWKAMSDSEKKVYIEESKRLRSELLVNHPDYKYKPRRRRNAPTSGANTMVNIPANLLSSVVNIPSNILNTIADKGANNSGGGLGIVSNGNGGLLQNYNIQIPFSLSKSGQQPLLSDSILQSLAMSSPRLGCGDSTISVPLQQLIASKHADSVDSKKRHAASLQLSRQSAQEDSSMHNYQLARLQQHLNPLNNDVESATAHLKNNATVNTYNSSPGVFLASSNKSPIDLLSLLKAQGLEELPIQASTANQYAQFMAGQRSQMTSSPSYFLASSHGLVNSSPSHLLAQNFTEGNGSGIGIGNGSAVGHQFTSGLVGEPQSRVVAINYSLNKT